mmetsp:Transcript_5440/g.10201  ORF Transcript_5440/g.10201 Transcript_5440/m.10201 type:complete len:91 (+) Transcript_5440:308-580(+)
MVSSSNPSLHHSVSSAVRRSKSYVAIHSGPFPSLIGDEKEDRQLTDYVNDDCNDDTNYGNDDNSNGSLLTTLEGKESEGEKNRRRRGGRC